MLLYVSNYISYIYKAIKKKQSDIFIYSKNNEFFFIIASYEKYPCPFIWSYSIKVR